MGGGQSKSVPDVQMRLKMSSREFDDDDEPEMSGFGRNNDRTRSKSNLSIPAPSSSSQRFETEEEEYFNKIYNKRLDKSVISVNSSVKSAPAMGKAEKDPDVAAAIAELEETFKGLEEGTAKTEEEGKETEREPTPPATHSPILLLNGCEEDSLSDFPPEDSHIPIPDTDLLSVRSGEPKNRNVVYGCRQASRLETGRTLPESYPFHMSSGSSSHSNSNPNLSGSQSRGAERFLISSYGHANIPVKMGRSSFHNSQSVLIQQRKDFEAQKRMSNGNDSSSRTQSEVLKQGPQDWTYTPPKIDGFDVDKFKEVNSKVTPAAIVILREREEDGPDYYSNPSSALSPAYTKDELDLIASLEREVY